MTTEPLHVIAGTSDADNNDHICFQYSWPLKVTQRWASLDFWVKKMDREWESRGSMYLSFYLPVSLLLCLSVLLDYQNLDTETEQSIDQNQSETVPWLLDYQSILNELQSNPCSQSHSQNNSHSLENPLDYQIPSTHPLLSTPLTHRGNLEQKATYFRRELIIKSCWQKFAEMW